MPSPTYPLAGGCACQNVRYQVLRKPLYVHACHCTWCQRETGSGFVLNAMIEATEVRVIQEWPVLVLTPSHSGNGQKVWRCGNCQIAVWSNYRGAGDKIRFLRVGTLDAPGVLPPDIHIFVRSKLPWIKIPDQHRSVKGFYNRRNYWTEENLERLAKAKRAK